MVAVAATDQLPDRLAGEIAEHGISVIDGFIPLDLVRDLALESDRLLEAGLMRPAQIGKGRGRRLDREIRGDLIAWFDPAAPTDCGGALLVEVERIRLALNRRLFLGLFDFEACHARYPEGAGYRRHRDRFSREGRRILTLVTYLNEDWVPGDGGELRVQQGGGRSLTIEPRGGRAVAFFSDRFAHEVLPARRPRRSVAGWFRGRP